jgi:hypothetical protein
LAVNLEMLRTKVTEPLSEKVSGISCARIVNCWEDVLHLLDVTAELESQLAAQPPIFTPETAGRDFALRGRISTFNKAAIEFSNIYMTVLLHEAASRRGREVTIGDLLKRYPHSAAQMTDSVLLGAYRIYAIRNKIVAHHDKLRYPGGSLSATGELRIFAFRAPTAVSQDETKGILALQAKYAAALPALVGETNYLEVLGLLFHGIPVMTGGILNSDRRQVDGLVEQLGCKSMTHTEMLAALTAFSAEVASLAPLR